MGSQEDNSLDGLLRRSLARGAPQEECPSADLLAAYSEQALDENELARFEKHFSKCSRCREILAVMMHSAAEAEVAQEPVLAVSSRAAAPLDPVRSGGAELPASASPGQGKKTPGLARWWWFAPVAATCLLVVILYLRNNAAHHMALRSEVAMSRSTTRLADESKYPADENHKRAATAPSPAVDDGELNKRDANQSAEKKKSLENLPISGRNYLPLQPLSPSPLAKPAPETGNGASAAQAPSDLTGKGVAPGQRADRSQALVREAAGAAGGAAGAMVGGAAAARPAAKAAPPNVPPPAPQSQAVQAQQDTGELDQLQQQSQELRLQQQRQLTPQGQKVPEEKSRSTTQTVEVTAAAEAISTTIPIPTPDKHVIFRIVGAGFIERTTDGGTTWQGQLVSQNAEFTAGSAPAPRICWLVGRGGAVFRTSDGANWRKIPPPTPLDLVGVDAKDASTATVTAVGGQKYSTENAGKIWIASR